MAPQHATCHNHNNSHQKNGSGWLFLHHNFYFKWFLHHQCINHGRLKHKLRCRINLLKIHNTKGLRVCEISQL
ncbi:hypothetical protein QVD17_15202 [Tagetes erecta]|uniref:Uncharacterized protein n=1 Tax=Tagetes erecta TaxID=13708 RepID=A0AAD8NYG3_TARER|nr:hypothetical protein QVD17_15202 [Tagetes erecta]